MTPWETYHWGLARPHVFTPSVGRWDRTDQKGCKLQPIERGETVDRNYDIVRPESTIGFKVAVGCTKDEALGIARGLSKRGYGPYDIHHNGVFFVTVADNGRMVPRS